MKKREGDVMTREDVMFAQEVADILGISVKTIQKKSWRNRTGCPIQKIGRRLISIRIEFNKWFRGLYG
jgi:hypothetical protein